MELGPLLIARTFQVEGGMDMPHSFVPSQSVEVPHGTEIQVWRADHINQLLRLAHAAAKASNDVRDAVLALEFEFSADEVARATIGDYADPDELPELDDIGPADLAKYAHIKVEPPGPCPFCGRVDMFEVNYVDVGTEAGMFDLIPGTFRCTNPACPTNLRRYIHAHPRLSTKNLTPCCGHTLAELGEGATTTTDDQVVNCPGKISNPNNPEEGTHNG